LTELDLQGIWSPPLKNISARFGCGVQVILGRDVDGTADLLMLCAGLRVARRGRVFLDGRAPSHDPSARRTIASLLPDEDLTGAGSVGTWLDELSRLRDGDLGPSLAAYAPDISRERALSSLSNRERRQLALALALGMRAPKLVLLHDPLAVAPAATLDATVQRILDLAREAVLIITTPSLADARRLGGTLHVLEQGVLVRKPSDAWPHATTPGLDVCLWVECDAPRELLAELARSPEVVQADYDARHAAGRLQLRGRDLEQLALAVTRAAVAAKVELRALQVGAADVGTVHGASAGLAHSAYRAAQAGRRSGASEPASAGTPRDPKSDGV
jgi:ABC-type taurine transport system ATPase subunit